MAVLNSRKALGIWVVLLASASGVAPAAHAAEDLVQYTAIEAPGPMCTENYEIRYGRDTNGNGILDRNEVLDWSQIHRCGLLEYTVKPEPAGENCAAGGKKTEYKAGKVVNRHFECNPEPRQSIGESWYESTDDSISTRLKQKLEKYGRLKRSQRIAGMLGSVFKPDEVIQEAVAAMKAKVLAAEPVGSTSESGSKAAGAHE